MAGFTDLDAVRNPSLGQAPYPARYMVRQIIGLSKETIEATPGFLGIASIVPVRRIELRFGKLSTVDFFDLNSVGSDSHLQFMNWVVDNNGAYDYAADTRGYTYGALIEYYDRLWAARFMEALMPTVANGMKLDWDLARARSPRRRRRYVLENNASSKPTSVWSFKSASKAIALMARDGSLLDLLLGTLPFVEHGCLT
jgi:high affinity Mn2+ porin